MLHDCEAELSLEIKKKNAKRMGYAKILNNFGYLMYKLMIR